MHTHQTYESDSQDPLQQAKGGTQHMLWHTDPFRDFDQLMGQRTGGHSNWAMPMDAYRRGDDVWVHVDLPGVAAESIDISVERNVLTISAERLWAQQQNDKFYMTERRQGRYRRHVHLGDGLDLDHIEADYSDGVLTLRIPMDDRAKPRRIQVSSRDPAIEVSGSEVPASTD